MHGCRPERVVTVERHRYRFPPDARLRRRAEFDRVLAAPARRSSGAAFTVLACPNGGSQARLGLAVSRRAARRATARNRLRRIVRESFRLHRHRLGGLDCVVMARPGAAERENRALFDELERHWARLARP